MRKKSTPETSVAAGRAPEHPAFDWVRDVRLGPELAREVRAEVRRRRRFRVFAGAVVACAAIFVGLLQWPRYTAVAPATVTGPGAVVSMPSRRVLPDGSIVELKPDAEIRVEYAPAVRRVSLLSGVAHFQVAKNAGRPFVVVANGVDVRAVGTAFSVELGERSVEVVVTEGTVALEPTSEAAVATEASTDTAEPLEPAAPQHITAGQRAVVSLAAAAVPAVEAISPGEVAQKLAWRIPRLEFSGTPLVEVVTLFRKHGGVHLAIGDASLAQVRVSGILRADNTAALFQLLAADHGITTESRGDETVLIRSH